MLDDSISTSAIFNVPYASNSTGKFNAFIIDVGGGDPSLGRLPTLVLLIKSNGGNVAYMFSTSLDGVSWKALQNVTLSSNNTLTTTNLTSFSNSSTVPSRYIKVDMYSGISRCHLKC